MSNENLSNEAETPALNKGAVMGSYNDGVFNGIRQCNAEFQVMLQQIHNDFTNLKRIRKKDVDIILNEYANIKLGEDVNTYLEDAPVLLPITITDICGFF